MTEPAVRFRSEPTQKRSRCLTGQQARNPEFGRLRYEIPDALFVAVNAKEQIP